MLKTIIVALVFHFFIAVLITYINWLNKNIKYYNSIKNNNISIKGRLIEYKKSEFKVFFLGRRMNSQRNDPVIHVPIQDNIYVQNIPGSFSDYYSVGTELECFTNEHYKNSLSLNFWKYFCLNIINIFFNIFLQTNILDYSLDMFEYLNEYNKKLWKAFKKTAMVLLTILVLITYIVIFNLYCDYLKVGIQNQEIYDKTQMSDKFSTLVILKKDYDYVGEFSCGRAIVKIDNLYGYIDENGKEIIPVQYPIVRNFKNEVAEVFDNSQFKNPQYIDIYGNYVEKPITKTTYDNQKVIEMNLPRFRSSKDNVQYSALIGIDGKEMTDYKYKMGGQFKSYNDLARIGVDKHKFYIWESDRVVLFGYIDVNGREIIKPKYIKADSNFGEDNIACVAKSFYIDIPLSGNNFYKNNYYYGVIDREGNTLIPFRYTTEISFKENLSVVKGAKGYNGGKWEIIKHLE